MPIFRVMVLLGQEPQAPCSRVAAIGHQGGAGSPQKVMDVTEVIRRLPSEMLTQRKDPERAASGITITTLPAPLLQADQLRGQSGELAAELLDVLLLSDDEGSIRSCRRQRSVLTSHRRRTARLDSARAAT